jgi:hypothetical protein
MLIIKTKTALALGVQNLGRVALYQFRIKVGLNSIKKLSAKINDGLFFSVYSGKPFDITINNSWQDQQRHFGYLTTELTGPPNWHKSCLTHKEVKDSQKPWYSISDFESGIGDIKGVWEASRFDWVLCFAQSVSSGNNTSLEQLNEWLADWVEHNQPYIGVNWKCGQEASIRVMHLAFAAKILQQVNSTSPALLSLIKAHLKRISPTIMYAIAQDNNHGTSEAAALYIGGSWLVLNGDDDGFKWQKQGLKWLENRAARLIENDGSFSQYSISYHRVMLDTYSMVEVWRRELALTSFSHPLYKKLASATEWLYIMTQKVAGDAPNLGANDGARLLPLTDTDYRDFRPTVQLASVLFHDKAAYPLEGSYDLALQWLSLTKPSTVMSEKESIDLSDGGYACLVKNDAFVLLNYPKFKFRPSHCDALHVDFWNQGINIFRDGGTYSYNAGQAFIDYYGGVKSHNTVEFDSHEQMPRLSRFLLGSWLKSHIKEDFLQEKNSLKVGYKDRFNCEHIRDVCLNDNKLTVIDKLSGFQESAVLRWRLIPADWVLDNKTLSSSLAVITLSSDVKIKRIELVTGYESRYYYQESELSVLEVEIDTSGTITTDIRF